MKKALSFILAAAMLLALCACGAQTEVTNVEETATVEESAAESEAAKADYPTKEITIVVPFAAGGASDIVARLFAESAKKYCDQPFVVVDQGGGGGVPATTEFLSYAADGYTMLYGASAPTCTQAVLSDIPYDVVDGLDYLCGTNSDDICVVVRADCEVNTLAQWIEWCKTEDHTWAAPNGGVHYFAALAIGNDQGFSNTYVPSEGGTDSIAKLLGETVDYIMCHPTECLSAVTSGEAKCISVFAEERNSALPDVPTAKEEGYEYVYAVCKGMILQPGVDPERREILGEICKNVLTDEEFIAACKDVGTNINYTTGEVYKATNTEMYQSFKAAVESLGS